MNNGIFLQTAVIHSMLFFVFLFFVFLLHVTGHTTRKMNEIEKVILLV